MIFYEEFTKLSMKIHVCVWVVWMVFIAIKIALSYTCRMFWYPNSLLDICILLLGLYILDLAMFPITLSLVSIVGCEY